MQYSACGIPRMQNRIGPATCMHGDAYFYGFLFGPACSFASLLACTFVSPDRAMGKQLEFLRQNKSRDRNAYNNIQ